MIEDVINLLSATLFSMTPILLAATGEIITEKAGVVNIGLEGIFIVSSFSAAVATLVLGNNPLLGLSIGAFIGLLAGVLHGIISVYLRGDQIIAGVGFNSFAYGISVLGMIGLWGSYSSSPTVNKMQNIQLSMAKNTVLTIPPLALLAILVGIIAWWFLEKTKWGLRLRACGEEPRAAEAMGVNVFRTRFYATVIGGTLTGIGGAFLVVGWLGSFIKTISAGRGFIALAIVAFSNWNPLMAILGAFIFGFFDALSTYLPLKIQSITGQQFTAEANLFLTIPYIATLVIVAAIMKRVKMPRALGKPYIKE
ncbi:inner-membrane translocator [Staphylothermus marinus F1]|uniref:Inner-membrane translocator n=1 Tax=Staphylothermus marinus (strain ATCC 43588 / DSM 3639 / JCM 9404 / F1) TaxID=399550 RepID=A3DMD9_STAMF|nr:ABC transporter permease [Staphylothermus marinus]ABN69799.1 inner-membrane translocator [Staphylothermus marinus F1]